MKKSNQENRKINQFIRRNPILLTAVLVSCCLLGGLLAKYIYQTITDPGQITSEYFYFTADVLGDTKMTPTEGTAQDRYSFQDSSTEGTWYLYGGSKHTIDINVQNYYDELRTTKQDITFKADVTVKDAEGKNVSTENTGLALKKNDQNIENIEESLSGNTKSQADLKLVIPSNSDWDYGENITVTVKISSTIPYEKTLTLNFVLYAKEAALRYEVKDSVGSPYAELIIMTNIEGTAANSVQPYIKWPETLSIDNTNKLTFSYKNGTFIQQPNMTERNMQVSEVFAPGRSESIYFFKSDLTANFTKGETIVNPVDGKYTINLND